MKKTKQTHSISIRLKRSAARIRKRLPVFGVASATAIEALALCLSASALADTVNVHGFTPAANPSYTFTEDAILTSAWNYGARASSKAFFNATYDMINDPLVELDRTGNRRNATLVDSISSLSLTMGYSVLSRVQLGASTSLSLVRMPDNRSEFGVGDTRLFTKVRLNSDRAPVVFALMPEVWAPTGRRALFLSNDSFAAGMRLIAERDFGVVQVAGNAGYRYAPRAQYRDLDMRSTIPLSLGAIMPIGPRWAINADASGEIPLPANRNQAPSSVYAGMRYRMPQDLMLSAGAAVGSLNGYSSADYRVIAGITFTPSARQEPQAPITISAVAKPARVEFTPKEVIIRDEVKFQHAKAELTPHGRALLDEVARVLKDNKDQYKLIVVEGYTNDIGTYRFNQKLSEDRAASVKSYLVSQGIDGTKLMTIGYGKTKAKPVKKTKHIKKTRAALEDLEQAQVLEADRRVAFKVVQ